MNKYYKIIEDLYCGTSSAPKFAVEEAPQISVSWFNPNKNSKYTEEVMLKQENSASRYIQSKDIADSNLSQILKISQVYFYTPSFTPESKKMHIHLYDFFFNFVNAVTPVLMQHLEKKTHLQSIFALILMYIDKGYSTTDFESEVEKFIQKLSDSAKSTPHFKLFKLMLGRKLKSAILGNDQNGDDKKKKMADLVAKKRELAKKKAQKNQNKFAALMDKVEVTDEILDESGLEGKKDEVIECVVSHENLQGMECYLMLAFCCF